MQLINEAKGMLAVLAAAGVWLLVPAAPAEASFACTYDAGTKKVSAELTAEPVFSHTITHELGALEDGRIFATTAEGSPACGEATLANTDSVLVTNVTPDGRLPGGNQINLPANLMPGATDEPGDSDEIEINVDLGAGEDGFRLWPGTYHELNAPNTISLGEGGGQAMFNVNADETTGIDNDITVDDEDYLWVDLDNGDDVFTAAGAAAGAEAPYSGSLNVDARGGFNTIVGGTGPNILYSGYNDDDVTGGPDEDGISVGTGDDYVAALGGDDIVKGAGGDDVLGGGPGDDLLRDRRGDDVISGGPGYDVCVDGDGEGRFRGCEDERG